MAKKASWHAPMPASKRRKRNRRIAILSVVALAIISLLSWLIVPKVADAISGPEDSTPGIDSSQVEALISHLSAQDYLEVEGKVELAHLGEQTAVGGYRKSDGTVVGTVRGGGTSVSFTDTGAEVFLRTDEAGWYLLGVEGKEEIWARTARGLLFDPIIVMPLPAALEAASGDYIAVSPTKRNYSNGSSLVAEGQTLIFTSDKGRSFAYKPSKERTAEGLENYVQAATRTQAEVIRDADKTWLRLPDGYVPDNP